MRGLSLHGTWCNYNQESKLDHPFLQFMILGAVEHLVRTECSFHDRQLSLCYAFFPRCCVRQRDIREHVDGEYAVQTQDQATLLDI